MPPELDRRHTRRQFLKGAGAAVVIAGAGTGAGVGIWRSISGDGARPVARGRAPTLDDFAENVFPGGPGRGGIPALDELDLVSASEAGFLQDEDFVFSFVHRGEARAYPQLVLVWHEIANDVIGGDRLSITYCPLTGSVVAFQGKTPDGRPLTFNTTGNLVNSNLLMFDRETDSEWPQILGTAISGPEKGATLTEIPLVWATWGSWRARHPDTQVLSTNTGFGRSYGSDPYGSYTPLGGYYEGGGPFAPVMTESGRLPPKEVVIGVKAGKDRVAVQKSAVERMRVLPFEAGGASLVAIWDDELATARVFVPEAAGRRLEFAGGELRDTTTGSTWSPEGEALEGSLAGAQLPLADFFDVMWFAWFAFFPQTRMVA